MTQCAAALVLCLDSVYSFCPRPLFTVQWGLKSLGSEGGRMLHAVPGASSCTHMYMTGQERTEKSAGKASLTLVEEFCIKGQLGPDRTATKSVLSIRKP